MHFLIVVHMVAFIENSGQYFFGNFFNIWLLNTVFQLHIAIPIMLYMAIVTTFNDLGGMLR